jgi:hypothetical protein
MVHRFSEGDEPIEPLASANQTVSTYPKKHYCTGVSVRQRRFIGQRYQSFESFLRVLARGLLP